MSGLLADIFVAGDRAKKRVKGLLDPQTYQNAMDYSTFEPLTQQQLIDGLLGGGVIGATKASMVAMQAKKAKQPLFAREGGIGGTSNNADIDYFGFTRHIPAKDFLSLATKTELDKETISWLTKQQQKGMSFGNPFFSVLVDNNRKALNIVGHEGRHRTQSIIDLYGPDTLIPVDIFPRGGLRRRNLSEEMMSWPLLPQIE